ncbi:MAG: type VII secretion integral membrane protein EccD [Dactylosporangium sp.]|nr:type VII secretion integral membrane protein EccD [Dactylosporangium sp.]NNJ63241.1 type VII secretion integral membrane protein EccD [Dactylosporangium sp.]
MTGLARVTIKAPHRRVDVALPDGVPVAEFLTEVLHHAGDGLADDGESHGGWLLRQADGTGLDPTSGLAAQGVRDGAVLHLVPAATHWPEAEYDDIVEVIVEGTRRSGAAWTAATTRTAGRAVAGIAAGLGLVGIWLSGPDWRLPAAAAMGTALLLIIAGTAVSRAYGDAAAGAALASYALPYAVLGGALMLAPGSALSETSGDERVSLFLVGSMALLVASIVAGIGVGHRLRVFVCGTVTGLLGAVSALLAYLVTPAGAAAIVLTTIVTAAGAIPLLAIRLGRLPLPVTSLPSDLQDSGSGLDPQPDRALVFAAVARTDEVLTGMLLAAGVAGTVAAGTVAWHGGVGGRILVGLTSVALLLRARLFVTVHQRLPLLGAGVAGMATLAVAVMGGRADGGNLVVATLLALLSVIIAGAAMRYATRAPSPYLGKAADVLEALCVVSAVPCACAVLGLYGLARGIVG